MPAPQARNVPGTSAHAITLSATLWLTLTLVQVPFDERLSTTDGAVPEFAITHMPRLPSLHMPVAAVLPGIRSALQRRPSKCPSFGTPATLPATQTSDRDNARTWE